MSTILFSSLKHHSTSGIVPRAVVIEVHLSEIVSDGGVLSKPCEPKLERHRGSKFVWVQFYFHHIGMVPLQVCSEF